MKNTTKKTIFVSRDRQYPPGSEIPDDVAVQYGLKKPTTSKRTKEKEGDKNKENDEVGESDK